MGDINVYTGPMKCGKTQKILDEAKRQQIAGKNVKEHMLALGDRETILNVRSAQSVAEELKL